MQWPISEWEYFSVLHMAVRICFRVDMPSDCDGYFEFFELAHDFASLAVSVAVVDVDIVGFVEVRDGLVELLFVYFSWFVASDHEPDLVGPDHR